MAPDNLAELLALLDQAEAAEDADVLEQPFQSLASTDIQAAFTLIGIGVDDLDPMVLGIFFDAIALVLVRILLMLG